jgi:hypothetical protein
MLVRAYTFQANIHKHPENTRVSWFLRHELPLENKNGVFNTKTLDNLNPT